MAASQVAKPLARRGKIVDKYVAKLRPTKVNGKVIGCKGASGRMVMKITKYSATNYRYSFTTNLIKLQNGGGSPGFVSYAHSCTASNEFADLISWYNIATDKDGRARRYSFQAFSLSEGPLADMRRGVAQRLSNGNYFQAGYTTTGGITVYALCGKIKKVV
ncbi:unnamed protein product [Closterium sp. Yama58-4]|nr:unnamed protein product [Closterium sp. Yama58-4]